MVYSVRAERLKGTEKCIKIIDKSNRNKYSWIIFIVMFTSNLLIGRFRKAGLQ